MNKYQEALDWLRESTSSLKHNQAYDILQELVDRKTTVEKEFVLFNKQGERIDSVDPYYMHKVIGNKVIVSNHNFEYELSLENGNTFEIVRMEE